MKEPDLLPEKNVFGMDKQAEGPSLPSTPDSRSSNIRFAVIILIVAAVIAAGLYYLRK